MKIQKSSAIQASEVSAEELAAINAYASAELTAEDVFTFKAVLCNDQIDRDMEAFSPEALHQLAELFKGKPVIKDHHPSADNQIARIYRTEIVEEGGTMQLMAYCYMVKTAGNADLIAEIKGGIKKEGSVGCAIGARTCSICGTSLMKARCRHIPGKSYDGKTCHSILSKAVDAYEFSLVAVPAQRNAGVSKSFEEDTNRIRLRARAITAGMSIYKED